MLQSYCVKHLKIALSIIPPIALIASGYMFSKFLVRSDLKPMIESYSLHYEQLNLMSSMKMN